MIPVEKKEKEKKGGESDRSKSKKKEAKHVCFNVHNLVNKDASKGDTMYWSHKNVIGVISCPFESVKD